jgi:hypothetical protein
MLLAAGGFTVYRKETYFYDVLPRFPHLSTDRARRRFAQEYLRGYLGRVPGVEVEPHVTEALKDCRSPAEFLPSLMRRLTEAQRMDRWVEATPVHVLCMNEIERAVPDALFVHVIRDGRDCAISTTKQRWARTLPWDRNKSVGVSALNWEWMVRCGRAFGRRHPAAYLEVRFEDLVAEPRESLDRVGRFIDHSLDYDRIRRTPVHSLVRPNTSFRDERDRQDFNPVGRWKAKCSTEDLRLCESLIGGYLEELGYRLALEPARSLSDRLRTAALRAVYPTYFTVRRALKTHTPLGRALTRSTVWAEQPKEGELAIAPTPAS